jgi:hypothetical protein
MLEMIINHQHLERNYINGLLAVVTIFKGDKHEIKV